MAKPLATDGIREANRTRLLAELRRDGPLSRTILGLKSNLSSATVSAITRELMRAGRLVDTAGETLEEASRGRPQVPLGFAPAFASVQNAYIAVEGVTLMLADYAGVTLDVRKLAPIRASATAAAVVDTLRQSLLAQRRDVGAPPTRQLVVAVQGVVDAPGRSIVWSPILEGAGLGLADDLGEALGCPVHVVNDAVAIVDGLSPRVAGDFGVVLMGFGVGMGLVRAGKTAFGHGHSALELGHVNHVPQGALCRCGRRGCLEAYLGDYGIVRGAGRTAGDATDHPPPGLLSEVTRAALDADPAARGAFAEAGLALGFSLARAMALLGPFPAHLVGVSADGYRLLAPHVRQGVEEALVAPLRQGFSVHHHGDGHQLTLAGTLAQALRAVDATALEAIDG